MEQNHILGGALQTSMAWAKEEIQSKKTPWNKLSKVTNTLIVASTKLLAIKVSKNSQRTRIPPSWRSFKEVSVSGIEATLDRHSPLLRRMLWGIVLVICTSLMFAQCFDRIMRYIDEPVNVNVRVTHNDTLFFPAITICNKKQFNLSAVLQYAKTHKVVSADANFDEVNVKNLMGAGNETVSELWETFAFKKDVYIPECWFKRNHKCEDVGEWSILHSVIGPCLTYRFNESTINAVGSFGSLYIRLEDLTPTIGESGARIVLHDPRENPTLLARTHSMAVEIGWSRDVKLELRKFQKLDTSKTPCTDNASYFRAQCGLQCFQNGLINYNKCRMPFMLREEVRDECRTTEEYDNGMKSVNEMLMLGGWNMADCDCEHECNSIQFQTYSNNIEFYKNNSRIRVFYTDMIYEHITEELAYPMISLLCDIGGTLGLLMGASVLTVCELLEVIWSYMIQGCCRLEERQPQMPTKVNPEKNKQKNSRSVKRCHGLSNKEKFTTASSLSFISPVKS